MLVTATSASTGSNHVGRGRQCPLQRGRTAIRRERRRPDHGHRFPPSALRMAPAASSHRPCPGPVALDAARGPGSRSATRSKSRSKRSPWSPWSPWSPCLSSHLSSRSVAELRPTRSRRRRTAAPAPHHRPPITSQGSHSMQTGAEGCGLPRRTSVRLAGGRARVVLRAVAGVTGWRLPWTGCPRARNQRLSRATDRTSWQLSGPAARSGEQPRERRSSHQLHAGCIASADARVALLSKQQPRRRGAPVARSGRGTPARSFGEQTLPVAVSSARGVMSAGRRDGFPEEER